MKITRIKGADVNVVADILGNRFRSAGYDVSIKPQSSTSINASGFRLSSDYVKKYGYNISPYTQRRGRILGWRNWVQVNNIVNRVLDELNVSANAYSLSGKFRIRSGKQKFTEADWDVLGDENVGSVMNPVSRRDAWKPENPMRVKAKLEEIV